MSALRALITQSRYGQAFARVRFVSNPLLSANRTTSSQCRAHRSPYCGDAR
jgi:hypothetical protein